MRTRSDIYRTAEEFQRIVLNAYYAISPEIILKDAEMYYSGIKLLRKLEESCADTIMWRAMMIGIHIKRLRQNTIKR